MKGSVVEINFSELEFGDELGEGGQGTVYHGTLKPQNMVVAIKKVSGKIREEEVSAPCFPTNREDAKNCQLLCQYFCCSFNLSDLLSTALDVPLKTHIQLTKCPLSSWF